MLPQRFVIHMLKCCTFRGIDEVDEGSDDLRVRYGEDACSFGRFCEGLEAACKAVQARRSSDIPPLRIELSNVSDTASRNMLGKTCEVVEAMVRASGVAPKVRTCIT